MSEMTLSVTLVRKNFVAPARNRSYNLNMARGWESKSVESQMESAQGNDGSPHAKPSTGEAKKNQRERQGLLLSRTYVLRQIESSSNERYTESLRQALKDIDQKLAQLGE
jgi:hypothetical protein